MNESYNKTSTVVLGMMILTLTTKFLGFIREILLGMYFGATSVTDAYIIATTIPMVLFVSIVTAIGTTFIPQYNKIKKELNNIESVKYSNSIINIVLLISFVTLCFAYIFIDEIVGIMAKGFTDDILRLTVNLTKIALPMILFLGIINIFIAILQAEKKFIITAFINIPITAIVIISLIFSKLIGINGVIVANIVGSIIQMIILYISLKKLKFRYKFSIDINNKYVKDTFKLIIPILIASSVQQINVIINRMLASELEVGSISALNFGAKINDVIFGLISVTIATFIFPTLSQLNILKSEEEFSKVVINALNSITLIIMPLSLIVLLMNKPIVRVLFERGEFNSNATLMTSNSLLYYSIGMVFFGYRDILNKTFYSIEDTKTPMFNGVLAIAFNIILNIILRESMGYKGLALASSLSVILTTILLYINLRNKIRQINTKKILITFYKTAIISLISAIITFLLNNIFINIMPNILFSLVFSIAIGIVIYISLLLFSKIDEVNYIINEINRKIR